MVEMMEGGEDQMEEQVEAAEDEEVAADEEMAGEEEMPGEEGEGSGD